MSFFTQRCFPKFMSDISGTGRPSAMMRLDTSRADAYLYPEKPKVSFFKKVGQTFGKAVSFLAPIAGAVTAVALPGVGLPLAAGMFGLGNLSSKMVQSSQAKQQRSIQEQQDAMANTQVSLPGFFDSKSMNQATNFIAPESQWPKIEEAILNRDALRGSSLQNF